MGYKEALEDNIPIEENKSYYPQCHICGASVFSMNYKRGLKYTCSECKHYLVEAKIQDIDISKKKRRLDLAIKRIEKVANITDYENAIRIVTCKLSKPGWFQSTEEIMVALELIRNNVKVHHQVKVFSFSVDFVLPEYKVALEIDGPLHQLSSRKKEDVIRDEVVAKKLGEGYQVIRISTDNINNNVTKLMKAINLVLKKRKK